MKTIDPAKLKQLRDLAENAEFSDETKQLINQLIAKWEAGEEPKDDDIDLLLDMVDEEIDSSQEASDMAVKMAADFAGAAAEIRTMGEITQAEVQAAEDYVNQTVNQTDQMLSELEKSQGQPQAAS